MAAAPAYTLAFAFQRDLICFRDHTRVGAAGTDFALDRGYVHAPKREAVTSWCIHR